MASRCSSALPATWHPLAPSPSQPSVRCLTAACATLQIASVLQHHRASALAEAEGATGAECNAQSASSSHCPATEHAAPRPAPPPRELGVTDASACCRVRGDEAVRVAVCFFGALRSLSLTLASLRANLLRPLHEVASGAVDVFIHSMRTAGVDSSVSLYELDPCGVEEVEQSLADSAHNLTARARSTYRRGLEPTLCGSYSSLMPGYTEEFVRNIYRSRFSLAGVAALVLSHERRRQLEYTHVVAARPDTAFLAPLAWAPARERDGWARGVWTPNYFTGDLQASAELMRRSAADDEIGRCARHAFPRGRRGGVNDRFALGDARSMLRGYMAQYDAQLAPQGGVPLFTSEILLCAHLAAAGVRVGTLPVCMVRVRGNGTLAQAELELFMPRERPAHCAGLRVLRGAADEWNGCAAAAAELAGMPPDSRGRVTADLAAAAAACDERKNVGRGQGSALDVVVSRYASPPEALRRGRRQWLRLHRRRASASTAAGVAAEVVHFIERASAVIFGGADEVHDGVEDVYRTLRVRTRAVAPQPDDQCGLAFGVQLRCKEALCQWCRSARSGVIISLPPACKKHLSYSTVEQLLAYEIQISSQEILLENVQLRS
ncbi:hypothetical protein AB1Y20_021179 [Prymnesium parvum]|uniref:Protein-tyrosine sulfotransferase n=1 Tax=Prymnesium parvum TaxID=97485 RepID=A0AB34JI14_PRYPA